ncbi:hypothetical protein BP6252_07573 [Coleophoma cylindrospora]|uniref:Uncharacterized protein n=1 Tax=Coleophoma cylindrospora TaxID=1849047 RepID=A0A3D8RAK6_9HELO|nr:hypothetical protein BP6252_07573 [Coleophoma cylindrospora]
MPIISIDDTMEGTALQKWTTIIPQGAAKLGQSVLNSKNYAKYMKAAGFVDIIEENFYWPLNTWPKGDIEKLLLVWFQKDLNGMSTAALSRAFGWSVKQIDEFLVDVVKDIKDRRIHSYVGV